MVRARPLSSLSIRDILLLMDSLDFPSVKTIKVGHIIVGL